jgi:hypothetical protein
MKALSLHQPWASLIGLGVKTIETRSWSTKYRGPLAVHASLRRPPYTHLDHWTCLNTITDPAYKGPQPVGRRVPLSAQAPTLFYPHSGAHARPWDKDLGTDAIEQGTAILLPLGAVVATCELMACERTEYRATCIDVGEQGWAIQSIGHLPLIDPDQYPLGDFGDGRFMWLLANIEAIDPVPAKGHQGLWEWDRSHVRIVKEATDG